MQYGPIATESPLVLSPMAGYTDHPFRLLCREQGAALVCTELLSSTAMWFGSERTGEMMDFTEEERPVGVQIFGTDPVQMAFAARKVTERGPDYIDINLGCSVPKVVKSGACSALTKDPERLRAVFQAVVSSTHLPVSAKMRKGWDEDDVSAPWISEMCQELGLCAVTIHGRTAREGFTGTADWDIVRHVKSLVTIPVLGSGDLRTPDDVKRRMEESGCDGVMIGRAAMGDPWFFARTNHFLQTGEDPPPTPPSARLSLMRRHLRMSVEHRGEHVGVVTFRSQVAAYCRRIPGGRRLRDAVMRMDRWQDIDAMLYDYEQASIEGTVIEEGGEVE